MEINLEPGKYVVAVSGGVDSVALLHLLHHQNTISRVRPWKMVVGHFDHGIRDDSKANCDFVAKLTDEIGLKFYSAEGKLGPKASEATAREARYKFLRKVKTETGSKAIITAHHQDDLIETILINILRGTGRKGLSPMRNSKDVTRPLLGLPKKEILQYAKKHDLTWWEDETNLDQTYLRNYLRHSVLPKLTAIQRQEILDLASSSQSRNASIDSILSSLIGEKGMVDRQWFASLPHNVASEVMAEWLRTKQISFDKKTIAHLSISAKTLNPGSTVQISQGWELLIGKNSIRLHRRKSV